jgi:hypothetical protein
MPEIDLALFDSTAPSETAAPGAAAESDGQPAIKAGEKNVPGSGRRTQQRNVFYGKQGEQSPAPETPEARREKFKALIGGEYKDLYHEEFQEAFNRRFKDYKTQGEKLQSLAPIVEALMARYKIADGDLSKLQKALAADTGENSAKEAGMPPEQVQAMERLRHENAAMKAAAAHENTDKKAMGQLARWATEGEQLKGDYEGFDIALESKNPRFLAMLRAGVPVRHAYEVLHLGDIKDDTARKTEKRVVDGIRAKGARPPENGMSGGSGIVVKSDVSRLTRRDREEIARRTLQGEKISF